MTALTLYFDGSCGPVNPGGNASYGWLLFQDSIEIARGSGVEACGPEATNNVAECVFGLVLELVAQVAYSGLVPI